MIIFQDNASLQFIENIASYWKFIAIAVCVVLAIIYLMSQANKQIHETEQKHNKSLSDLLKTRETQISDKDKEIAHLKDVIEDLKKEEAKLRETIADVRTEYQSLAGIVIHELLDFQSMRVTIEAHKRVIAEMSAEIQELTTQTLKLTIKRDSEK